jgi:hypothetical protein
VDPALAAAALAEGASPLTARETEVLTAARGHAAIADLAAALHLSPARSVTTCPPRSRNWAPETALRQFRLLNAKAGSDSPHEQPMPPRRAQETARGPLTAGK